MKKIILMLLLVSSGGGFAQNTEEQTKWENQYFESQMAGVKLDALTSVQKKKIRADYDKQCAIINENKNISLFYKIAVKESVKDSMVIYNIFKDELDKILQNYYPKALVEFKAKYSLTDSQVQAISSLIYNRTFELQLRHYTHPDNATEKYNNEQAIYTKYNTSITNELTMLGVSTYLTGYCKILKDKDEIQLSDSQVRSIISAGWNISELKRKNPDSQIDLEQYKALKKILTNAQYEKYVTKKIDAEIKADTQKQMDAIKTKYNLNDTELQSFSNLIYNKVSELQRVSFTLLENEKEKQNTIQAINDKYNVFITNELTKQGKSTYLTGYCKVLKEKIELQLSANQVDSIIAKGWKISKLKINDPNCQIDLEQHKVLKTILNNAQYEKYITKNAIAKANTDYKKSWQEMKKHELAPELDSTSVASQLKSYYTERAKIQEQYSIMPDKSDEMETKLAALKQMEPAVLKKLYYAKKKEENKATQNSKALTW